MHANQNMCLLEDLIQKIYQADPLMCPKCRGQMRIISFFRLIYHSMVIASAGHCA